MSLNVSRPHTCRNMYNVLANSSTCACTYIIQYYTRMDHHTTFGKGKLLNPLGELAVSVFVYIVHILWPVD